MFVLALILSLLIGAVVGLLGGGGSTLTVPLLKYVLGQDGHEAIPGSLLLVVISSLSAIYAHARAGRVRWKPGLVFGVATMLGSYPAGRLAEAIPSPVLMSLFGALLTLSFFAMMRKKPAGAVVVEPQAKLHPVKAGIVGTFVGGVTGLVGAGGGFIIVPALTLLVGLRMDVAVGTSLLVLTLNASAAFAGHISHAVLDWGVLLPIIALALIGSFLGATLVARFPVGLLKRVFAWFIAVMGVFILSQEIPEIFGVSWPMSVSLALGGLVAVLGTLVELRASRAEPPLSSPQES